jgi:hypothetical protein
MKSKGVSKEVPPNFNGEQSRKSRSKKGDVYVTRTDSGKRLSRSLNKFLRGDSRAWQARWVYRIRTVEDFPLTLQ